MKNGHNSKVSESTCIVLNKDTEKLNQLAHDHQPPRPRSELRVLDSMLINLYQYRHTHVYNKTSLLFGNAPDNVSCRQSHDYLLNSLLQHNLLMFIFTL